MTSRRISHLLTQAAFALALAVGGTLALAPFSPGGAAFAQSSRDAQAEQFVQGQGQRIITLLSNPSLSQPDKTRAFKTIVDQIADVPRITGFVLGKYARSITPAQMQQFAPVFRAYEQSVYETQLSNFHGKILKVTGSVVRQPGDVVVNTAISGGGLSQPLPVAWRVLGGGGSWKVVDVQASGVWLAITQQQDFVSTIDNHGGDIDALIAQLQQQARRRVGDRSN
jgi:phospholipid transport system substrate-binding protein